MDKLKEVMQMDTWLKGEQIKLTGEKVVKSGYTYYTAHFTTGYQKGKEIVVTDQYLDNYIASL